MKKINFPRKIFMGPYLKDILKDILLCGLLMTVFAAPAFFNLGDIDFPRKEYIAENERVVIDFGKPTELRYVIFCYGGRLNTGFRLYSWDGNDEFILQHEETNNARFHWLAYPFQAVTRYAVFEPIAPGISILEMGFYDNSGSLVEPTDYSEGAAFMFDEPSNIPQKNPSFVNDIVFDETFYATTAYDFIHGFPPFELTHPPLGKSIIALGINMFGMTPFGWRFMSALFGVLMVIPIYAMGRRMFGSRWLALIAASAFTFDFMHFVQSRIANIDIFLVTFIILMYLFMYEYVRTQPEKRLSAKSLVCLGLSGAFMGLAISVKWSAAFAGIGLLVVFIFAWIDYTPHYDLSNVDGEKLFKKDFLKTMMFGVLFFVIVPVAIYFLSYIPLARSTGISWPMDIVKLQSEMLGFHTRLSWDTDFQSRWWTWPLNLYPVNCYTYILGERGYTGVQMFGNPALWWGGLLALVWSAKRWIANKDKTARFLCCAWIAQILPWVFISRSSYIYHYFPCVPFLALMVAHFISTLQKKCQYWFAFGFSVLVIVLFVMFFPVLNGVLTADYDYVIRLEWLPGWDFTNILY